MIPNYTNIEVDVKACQGEHCEQNKTKVEEFMNYLTFSAYIINDSIDFNYYHL